MEAEGVTMEMEEVEAQPSMGCYDKTQLQSLANSCCVSSPHSVVSLVLIMLCL